jgi:hypothetical protein
METAKHLAAALAFLFAAASPCLAGVAVIETTAPLTEQSNEGIKMAVVAAVQSAVKGATAMGLPHFAVKGVRVFPQVVIVQIWATDAEADLGDKGAPEDPVDESKAPSPTPRPRPDDLRAIDSSEGDWL